MDKVITLTGRPCRVVRPLTILYTNLLLHCLFNISKSLNQGSFLVLFTAQYASVSQLLSLLQPEMTDFPPLSYT